jgi:RNA polymerase sigma factor (TIGR02999 family)
MPNDPQEQQQPNTVQTAGEITVLLRRLSHGDVAVISSVMTALYSDLKRIAEGRMRWERIDHTLEPAALVNELFLQFAKNPAIRWESRKHFLGAASQEMRRLLVDYARAHNSIKRGGGVEKVPLAHGSDRHHDNPEDFLQVNELLSQLTDEEPRVARVVEMRCFGGLTHNEIAEVLGLDERTVKRVWRFGKAWLESRLQKGGGGAGRGTGSH